MAKRHNWTCGHLAGSHCAKCYSNLAWAAHIFAEVCDDALAELRKHDAPLALALGRRLTVALNSDAEKTISNLFPTSA